MTSATPRKPVAAKRAAVRKPAVPKVTVPKVTVPKVTVPKVAAKPAKKPKKDKKAEGKVKVVRDSFTMPQADYDLIAELKLKAQTAGLHVKKSELLRAGLQAVARLSAAQLKRAVAGLEKIKTGRPSKA